MGVNSLPKTVTRQRRDCDLNPGPSAPESSTLTTRLPSHPARERARDICSSVDYRLSLGSSAICRRKLCAPGDRLQSAWRQVDSARQMWRTTCLCSLVENKLPSIQPYLRLTIYWQFWKKIVIMFCNHIYQKTSINTIILGNAYITKPSYIKQLT